jgi:hypothetical protein
MSQAAGPLPETRAAVLSPATADLRRVSWGAILAGVVVALALHVLLSLLGTGIGFATLQPAEPGQTPSAASIGMGAAAWWAISGIVTAFIGGWVAARLAGIPSRGAGTLHGLASWAATILVVLYLISSTATSMIGGALGAMGQAAAGLGNAAGGAVSSATQVATQGAGNPLDQIMGDVRAAANPNDPQAAGQQLASAVQRMMTGEGDAANEARQAAVDVLTRQGVAPEEAQRRVDEWKQRYDELTTQAEQQARAAADAAATGATTAAFYAFIALLLGAIAGALGGRTGTPRAELLVADRR